jgi:hypothetical protein
MVDLETQKFFNSSTWIQLGSWNVGGIKKTPLSLFIVSNRTSVSFYKLDVSPSKFIHRVNLPVKPVEFVATP